MSLSTKQNIKKLEEKLLELTLEYSNASETTNLRIDILERKINTITKTLDVLTQQVSCKCYSKEEE